MNRLWTLKSVVLAGAGFALTSLAFLSAGGGDSAPAQALANHNGNAPVDMAANALQLQAPPALDIVTGTVRSHQAGKPVHAPRQTTAHPARGGPNKHTNHDDE